MKMQGRTPFSKIIKYFKKTTQSIQPSVGAFWAGAPENYIGHMPKEPALTIHGEVGTQSRKVVLR